MSDADKTKQSNPDEEAVAEEHVKRIMDPNEPDPAPELKTGEASTNKAAGQGTSPPLDIFEGKDTPGTAPEVSEEVAQPEAKLASKKEQAEQPKPTEDDADPETDKAVDDITKAESDEMLKAEDRLVDQAFVMKPGLWERFKNFAAAWWEDPRKRYGSLAGLLAVIVIVAAVPVSRYFVLNAVGVRSSVSATVLDQTTDLPLKNVDVTLAGQTGKTDEDGKVTLTHVKLGKQTLEVHKSAFADYKKTVTVGLGSMKLPSLELKAVGSQFTFNLTDYLSGKGIASGEVTSGEASAQSDDKGKAILTVQPNEGQKLDVQVTADGYRTEKLQLDPGLTAPTAVSLVTKAKEVFVSKASGKYDLYSVDIDGKNKHLLLAGTGTENQNVALSVSPDNSQAALVSTRDNQHDADGFLLSALTLVKVDGSATLTVDHAEQITLLGWADDKLIYEETAAGASAANPNRQKIIAYDYGSNKRSQLASANYFNATSVVKGVVYYAVSSSDPSVHASFNKVNADGSSRQTLLSREVWSMFRTAYGTFDLQTPTGWASYTVGDSGTRTGTAPDSYISRQYLDNAAGSQSLWVDNRDGKGVLLKYDVGADKDTTVTTQSGLSSALRWLDDNTVVYRVTSPQQTADYAVSLKGGQPHKITDVTATYGLAQAN